MTTKQDLIKWAIDNLCVNDLRSPNFIQDDEPYTPRLNCSCDKCFYGKDKIAMMILDYFNNN